MSSFDLVYQNQHIHAKIVAGLERIAEVFKVLLWDISKEYQLTPIQSQILIFLASHSSLPQHTKVSYLSQELNVTKATISESLKILLRKELISKTQNPEDRRSIFFSLTPKGEVITKHLATFSQPLEKILQAWSFEQKQSFFQLLLELIYSLNQQGIVSVSRICFNCSHYSQEQSNHFCRLLQKTLHAHELRIDCPEHKTPQET